MEEKTTEDIKEKLKNILGISKCNHKVEIMKETDCITRTSNTQLSIYINQYDPQYLRRYIND